MAAGEVSCQALDPISIATWRSWEELANEPDCTVPEDFVWDRFYILHNIYQASMSRERPDAIPLHCRELCTGLRFLVTEQGHSGFGPAAMQKGDKIVWDDISFHNPVNTRHRELLACW